MPTLRGPAVPRHRRVDHAVVAAAVEHHAPHAGRDPIAFARHVIVGDHPRLGRQRDTARLARPERHPLEAGEAVLKRALERVRGAPVAVETVLVPHPGGRLADRVLQQASEWPADLVVLGTHGRRGVGRMLLGSDAEQVLRTAPVPVLLVRAPNAPKG